MEFIFKIEFVWLAIVQLFAFFIQGVTGFGCSVISAPFHSTMLSSAQIGTAFATFLTIPTLLFLGIKEIKNVAWKDLGKIVLLCAPGMIIGNIVVGSMDATVARVAIGAVVTFIAVMNIYKSIIVPLVLKKEMVTDAPDTAAKKALRYIALIVGGIVHGAFNIGGPLITVYTLEAVSDKEKFRNTMTWVWVTLNLYNVFNHVKGGLYTSEMLSASFMALPLSLIGLLVGMKVLKKIDRITFLRAVYIVLLIIGGDMLIKNLPLLFAI